MWLRRGERKVFYLCKRVAGVPRQVRVGTGPAAEKMAAELEARKRDRKARAEACAAWEQRVGELEGPLEQLCAGLEQAAAGALLLAGFHRLGRHAWSKRRVNREVQAE
jgi:hypothetical protein